MNLTNIGRILFGIIYIVAAIFNFVFTMQNAQLLWNYLVNEGQVGLLKIILQNYIIPNSKIIITIVILFELTSGILILNKGLYTKIGLTMGVMWTLGLIPFFPLGPPTVVNIVLLIIQVYLLRFEYQDTLLDLVKSIL
jgi:hypothetical protein